MVYSTARACLVGVCLTAAVACSKTSPSQPSQTAPAITADATASIVAPRPIGPVNNAQIKNADQPVTLTVANAISTQPGAVYTFEVASDAAFSSKVQTKDGVAEGSGGATSVRLDALPAGRDYYWHARATAGGTTGVFGTVFKFTIGPALVLNAPVPIGPLTGAQGSPRAVLRVTNATRSGPVGSITYRFEIARDSAFASLVMAGTNVEGVNETGFIPPSDLPTGLTLFWRAFAIDASNGITSASSAVQSFTTVPFSQAERIANLEGIVLWPGKVPPGTVGHAEMGHDPDFGTGWNPVDLFYYPTQTRFHSPDAEMLRIFDLLDRGFHPDDAIGWMKTNGYPTEALWYPPPEKAVIGLKYVYLASRGKVVTNSIWDIVLRVE